MHRSICLIHANCQGDEIERLLLASPAFQAKYRTVRYTNYTREHVKTEDLQSCHVFLYQHLGTSWGNLASDALLAQIPATALPLCLPNVFFKGYWPLWTNNTPIDFGDSLLNRLIDEGHTKPVILKLYLHKDIPSFVDLPASLEETWGREAIKEQKTFMSTLDFVQKYWQKKSLFHTVNHPGKDLLLHVAQGVLTALDLPCLTVPEMLSCERQGLFPSYADFDLPIHPQVAAFYKLAFIHPGQTYAVFGRRMTFEQYISRYIDCRLQKMDKEFFAYLQLV